MNKIIYLWNYGDWGGAQVYLFAIMKVAKEEWDIVVILPRDSSLDILASLDQIGVRYEFINACTDIKPAPTIKRKLERQWRRIHAEISSFRHLLRYDLRKCILHIEIAPWQSWILFTALILRRANVFVTVHNAFGSPAIWRSIVWKIRLQFISRLPGFHIFTANRHAKETLKGWVSESCWHDIKVTTAGVNPAEILAASEESFEKSKTLKKHKITCGKFVVLCVGQFIDRKGPWIFLDAATTVLAQDSNVTFVWLTPKLPSADDMARIDEYGLNIGFRLLLSKDVGTSRHDVLTFFRIADVFALPSFVEGLPIALLESMALGTPSISTDVYAISEAIKHLDTGILIESGDSDALAENILTLKSDDELRKKLSKNGSAFVLKNFNECDVARIVLQSYKDSLAGK